MRKILLAMLAVSSTCSALPFAEFIQEKQTDLVNKYNSIVDEIIAIANAYQSGPISTIKPLSEIKAMLIKEAPTLSSAVIDNVLTTLKCADQYNVNHNNILTVIDYSLPSNQKRLWIFDLKDEKLLFNTYVSHGITSGSLLSDAFSNRNNSKASSIGVYTTEKSYYGRDGLSLRLDGLDRGFNDNAQNRAVVMHGGWYVDEAFIKKYGRAGRSWGCPALPLDLYQSVINTIKEKSLFVVYYPADTWLAKSKFLRCDKPTSTQVASNTASAVKTPALDQRDDILFVDVNKNNVFNESKPVIVVTADYYTQLFHTQVPLTRMLRRQINNMEYIALSSEELKNLVTSHSISLNHSQPDLNELIFVIPEIKMRRGYYATEMKIVPYGKIKEVTLNTDSADNSYVVHFEARPDIRLKTTSQFIRWVGL